MASDLFADEPGVTVMGSVGIYSQDPNASPSITLSKLLTSVGRNRGFN